MKRRQFILGLGTTAASGAAIVGSGAFSSVEANRDITVETARDEDAFLRLANLGNGGRSQDTGGTIRFEFPSLQEQHRGYTNPQNPQGLGSDSVYRFGSDVDGPDGLFEVQNLGTQPVDIYAKQKDQAPEKPTVKLYNVQTGTLLTEGSPFEDLGVGDSLAVGFKIDTHGVDARDSVYRLVITIVGEA